MRKRILLTLITCLLASCKEAPQDGNPPERKTVPEFIESDSAAQTAPAVATLRPVALDTSSLEGSSSAKSFALQTWGTVTTTCPGFTLYAADLSIVGISDMHESMYSKEVRGTGVTIQVAQSPRLIPSEFGASGHTCNYRVTPDRRGVIVEKAVCAAICTEQPTEETGANRILELKGRP